MHQQSIGEKGSFYPELMVDFPNFQCTNNQLAKRTTKSANFINLAEIGRLMNQLVN
jgi:hypothetical protein